MRSACPGPDSTPAEPRPQAGAPALTVDGQPHLLAGEAHAVGGRADVGPRVPRGRPGDDQGAVLAHGVVGTAGGQGAGLLGGGAGEWRRPSPPPRQWASHLSPRCPRPGPRCPPWSQAPPTLVQVTVGAGTPEATQGREAGTPSLVTWWVAVERILGGTCKEQTDFVNHSSQQ